MSWIRTATQYSKVITVAPDGSGDFTSLREAINSITDATENNRYLIQVYGHITENAQINQKSHIDIEGHGAIVEVVIDGSGPGLYANNITDAKCQNIIFKRAGDVGDYNSIPCLWVTGITDKTVKYFNCEFYNETISGGSGGNYCCGICTSDFSSPTFSDCRAYGGEITSHEWNYNIVNKFQPYTGKPYQILSCCIYVDTAISGNKLVLGTNEGGSEIASNIDISSTGWKYFTINRKQISANEFIYVTPTEMTSDNTFTIYYDVITNFNSNALCLYTIGNAKFSNCDFVSNGASDCIRIITTAKNYNLSHCSCETFDEEGIKYAICSNHTLTNAPIYKCNFKGKIDTKIGFDTQRRIQIIEDELSDAVKNEPRPPQIHSLAGDKHSTSTLAELNAKVSDAQLDDKNDTRTPKAHHLAGAEHSITTLAELNAKVSDAQLDDKNEARPPASHTIASHSDTSSTGTQLDKAVEHTNAVDNPHGVTKAQVGLGNVDNKNEATIIENAHKKELSEGLSRRTTVVDTTTTLTNNDTGLIKIDIAKGNVTITLPEITYANAGNEFLFVVDKVPEEGQNVAFITGHTNDSGFALLKDDLTTITTSDLQLKNLDETVIVRNNGKQYWIVMGGNGKNLWGA